MNKIIIFITLIFCVLLVGCDSYQTKVERREGTENVREVPGGYLMYEIESGKVTCKEHVWRSEIACWRNNNE